LGKIYDINYSEKPTFTRLNCVHLLRKEIIYNYPLSNRTVLLIRLKVYTCVHLYIRILYSFNRLIHIQRLQRRHNLLIVIALIFFITWLPLNVLNLVLNLYNPFKHQKEEETIDSVAAASHILQQNYQEKDKNEMLIICDPRRLY